MTSDRLTSKITYNSSCETSLNRQSISPHWRIYSIFRVQINHTAARYVVNIAPIDWQRKIAYIHVHMPKKLATWNEASTASIIIIIIIISSSSSSISASRVDGMYANTSAGWRRADWHRLPRCYWSRSVSEMLYK